MSIIESIINGIINGLMFWVVIILLLVAWVFFGAFIKIAVLLVLTYYGCKFAYKLLKSLGDTDKK